MSHNVSIRTFGALLVLGFLVFVSGCVRTTQPILLDTQVVDDPSFVGNWVSDDGKTKIDITAGKEPKSFAIHYVDEDGKKGEFAGRVGKVNTLLVAEIRVADLDPNVSDTYKLHLVPLYSFFIVQKVSSNQLSLMLMKDDWLKKYVDAHPEELKLAELGKDYRVITSSTEEFQTFLKRHITDEGAFGDPAVLKRK